MSPDRRKAAYKSEAKTGPNQDLCIGRVRPGWDRNQPRTKHTVEGMISAGWQTF